MRRAIQATWAEALGLAAFGLLWQVGATLAGPLILPSPADTFRALVGLAASGRLAAMALTTAQHTLAGFGLAFLLGGVLGTAAGLLPVLRRMLWPVVSVIQGIPQVAWILLAMFWFGTTAAATPVFTVAVAVLPVVFAPVVEGVGTADPALLAMARAFRAPRRVLLADLYLPHLLSYLFPAATTGLGIAWKVAVMAELMTGDRGVGAGLASARVNLQTADAMAWIAVVVLMLFGVEYLLLRPLKQWLEPWRYARDSAGEGESHAGA